MRPNHVPQIHSNLANDDFDWRIFLPNVLTVPIPFNFKRAWLHVHLYSVRCVSGSNNVVRMRDARSNARCKLDFYWNNIYNFESLVEDSRGIHLHHELERRKKKEFTARDIYTVWAIISSLGTELIRYTSEKREQSYTYNVFEFSHWLDDRITNTVNRSLILRHFEN